MSPPQGSLWSWPGAGALVVHPPALATFLSVCAVNVGHYTLVCVITWFTSFSPTIIEICLFQFIHHRIHNAGHTARHKQVVNQNMWNESALSLNNTYRSWEWVSAYELASSLSVMNAPPPHISTLFKFCPITPPKCSYWGHPKLTNQQIQSGGPGERGWGGQESVLILLEFSAAFDSVDYFLLETLHYLGFHGNPLSWLVVACLKPSFSFSLVTYPHLDWYFKCHCNLGFCPGPCPVLFLWWSYSFSEWPWP